MLSLTYNVTKLHHIFVAEFNFNQDDSGKRAGIFRFKIVLSNTDSRYRCTNYENKIPSGGKNLNKQQHYLNIENIWENGTMAVVGNVTHRHDVVIDKKSTLFGRLFLNLFCLIKSYSQSK